jgi:hypothetical protein
MPPVQMMSSLKTVAEAVISLLTMLLQFLIHQLEVMPDDAESPSEMMGVMEGMVQELQNQRAILQGLMTTSRDVQKRGARSSTGDSTSAGASPMEPTPPSLPIQSLSMPSVPNQVSVNSQRVAQALQRPSLALANEQTAVTGRVTNWQLIEEMEEEVVLDLEGRNLMGPNLSSANVLGSTGALGPMIPRASAQMTVGDWSQCRVTWGKKHKGKTYHQVLTLDPSYYQWAVARFQSHTPEQQDFVRYCQVQMDLDRRN